MAISTMTAPRTTSIERIRLGPVMTLREAHLRAARAGRQAQIRERRAPIRERCAGVAPECAAAVAWARATPAAPAPVDARLRRLDRAGRAGDDRPRRRAADERRAAGQRAGPVVGRRRLARLRGDG